MVVQVVLDTNVLVAAIRSRQGASFQVLRRVGTGAFDVVVSVPLVVEYESALLRHAGPDALDRDDVLAIVDYVCAVARRQPIFYLWRPLLTDPADDMVAEAAVAGGCHGVVTHNWRHFAGIQRFGLQVWGPGAFLEVIGENR